MADNFYLRVFIVTVVTISACFDVTFGIEITINGAGKIKGSTVNTTGILVDTFHGIPFAKPPVGDLRFAPPQPAEPWVGTRNGSFKWYACPQYSPTIIPSSPSNILSGTEDCLYLSVYRPRKAASRKMPVMVWIHGGGYTIGTGSFYNGEVLAAKNDVIVVTVNYRLGILGFLNIPGTKTDGNYGIRDQILGLKWVKQHIEDFGGDAQQVTIFGESAGAGSVTLLMLSPLAKGLFSRVIAQSGSPLNPWVIYDNKDTKQVNVFASRIGCKDLKTATECARKKHWKEILQVQSTMTNYSKIQSPNVDGVVFSGHPLQQMKDGKLAGTNIDLMIGFNTDEGTMFVPSIPAWTKAFYDNFIGMTMAMQDEASLATKLASFQYHKVIKRNESDYEAGCIKFTSDKWFKLGIINFAMEWSRKNKNTYLYHFDYLPKYLMRPNWGVTHALDIDFVFGAPFLGKAANSFLIANFTEEDKSMSVKVMKMWSDFAKNGKPGMGLPTVDAVKKRYFVINKNITAKENYDPKMMAFWNDYVPEITKMKSEASDKSCVKSASYSNHRSMSALAHIVILIAAVISWQ